MKIMKSCKSCRTITEENICPRCNSKTSKDWQGYLVVLDYEKSQIAENMNLEVNGKFSLRVRK